jgi:hypothetical protein
MNCTVDTRRRARACAETLSVREPVLSVDVLEPHADPTAKWTLDILLAGSCDGVPPQICDDLGSYRMSLRIVSRQGPHWQAIATA